MRIINYSQLAPSPKSIIEDVVFKYMLSYGGMMMDSISSYKLSIFGGIEKLVMICHGLRLEIVSRSLQEILRSDFQNTTNLFKDEQGRREGGLRWDLLARAPEGL